MAPKQEDLWSRIHNRSSTGHHQPPWAERDWQEPVPYRQHHRDWTWHSQPSAPPEKEKSQSSLLM